MSVLREGRYWRLGALLAAAGVGLLLLLQLAPPLPAAGRPPARRGEPGAARRAAPGGAPVASPHAARSGRRHRQTAGSGEGGEESPGAPSAWSRFKMRLPFWPRKLVYLAELALFIGLGVVLAQALEVAGLMRALSAFARPALRLGRLPPAAGPSFVVALQSGAAANSMLVTARDTGGLDRRQLYTAVLVVSCLSLFAHLPSSVLPVAAVLGGDPAGVFFGLRFGTVVLEILAILAFSRFALGRGAGAARAPAAALAAPPAREPGAGFCRTVWRRSRRTLLRLGLCVVPTYLALAGFERAGFFDWLTANWEGLPFLSLLPPPAAAIVPAQALGMVNGALAAQQFLAAHQLGAREAVLILLVGSIVTAPFRTLKHALPTYVAVLGPRAGTILAFAAQALRVAFLAGATAVCFLWIWRA